MVSRHSPVVRFGPFEADLAARELRKNGVRLKLQDQPFRVLQALLEKPGEVVTREELQERIWGEDTYVDFDKSLSAAIGKVREALGDSRTRPRYIETIPKVGYRFLGALEEGVHPREESGDPQPRRWLLALAAFAAAVAALFAVRYFWPAAAPSQAGAVVPVAQPVPLTSYPGEERGPTFSPDGTAVAFTRRVDSKSDYDIWIKPIGEAVARQLTDDPADEFGAAWSPDGKTIAFLRRQREGAENATEIVLVSPQGGIQRSIGRLAARFHRFNLKRLSWSPDSRYLLVDGDQPQGVSRISVDTGQIELVRDAGGNVLRGGHPVYSRDGEAIAYLRDFFEPTVEVFYPASGRVRSLGKLSRRGQGLAWLAEGRGLVAAEPLSFIPLDGNGPRPLAGLSMGRDVAYSPASRRLVFSSYVDSFNNWLIDAHHPEKPARRFAASTETDVNPTFSPNGRRVAFTSFREGKSALWVADFPGGATLPLGGPSAGSPRWAPDGSEIVFDAPGDGTFDVYSVPSFGGTPRLVAGGDSRDTVPSYSRDGQWIYFASDRSGEVQVWKTPVEGEQQSPGGAVQITRDGGFLALESEDGRYVYYAKRRNLLTGSNAIWRIPVGGGEEEPVVAEMESNWGNWALAGGCLYFIDRDEGPSAGSGWAVYARDLETHETERIAALPHEPVLAGPAFDVSPDGRWILYSANDSNESDLLLVEGIE